MTFFLDTVTQNLFSAPILFLILGIVAGVLKSDLELPDSISRYLAIYLMISIGFKGGVAIANTNEFTYVILQTIVAGIAMSFTQPFLGYILLRITTKLDKTTAAAVSAHYGSVSIVTFATAVAFLKVHEISYVGYIVAILSLMEAPAILSGLFIAHRVAPKTNTHKREEKRLSREIFTNGAILLLFGSFVIGCITGQKGMDSIAGFLVVPFQGFLCLFLLDMGLLVAKNFHQIGSFSCALLLFGLYMPLIGALLGAIISYAVGLDVGTGTLFITLCASSSYIAVPAAMRLVLPEAQHGVYVPMSVGVTFPFNVSLGIPIYFSLAQALLG
jgi:hypothetical protein